ncbi:MAG: hypothetical protein ABEI06_07705 [Halobacteriaceae archaeon]
MSEHSETSEEETGSQPAFRNSNLGISVWVNKSDEGTYYLRVNLPLIESFNVFPESSAAEAALEKLWEHQQK